jgi:hypothetical protein
MPKEVVYTGETFLADAEGNEWPANDARGKKGEFCHRGVDIRWGRGGSHVEVGVAVLDSGGESPRLGDRQFGHYTTLDEKELATLIKTLQRAGRQTFGESAW